jgi:hypothetical protein
MYQNYNTKGFGGILRRFETKFETLLDLEVFQSFLISCPLNSNEESGFCDIIIKGEVDR